MRVALLLATVLFATNVYAEDNKKVADTAFWTLTAVHVTSAIFDIESTFYTLDRCVTCVEANPLMAPIVKKGRLPTYAVVLAVTVANTYLSYQLKKRTKWWWIVPSIGIGTHTYAGTANFRLAWSKSF